MIASMMSGARIAKRMPQQTLKKGFGYFLIVMGINVLARTALEVLNLAT
jgi:uncharacterized membrane protein YfcA